MSVAFTNTFTNTGPVIIPELSVDPVSPTPESAWVLRTGGTTAGVPIGLLLALTYSTTVAPTYQFSYRTLENTTVRTTLV